MRNTNKKGFTIVELAIVVAVIAILAAVLIPTFSGVIDNARRSADMRAVQEMNTYIAMEEADSLEKALAALEKHKVNSKNLTPLSAGYSFVWNNETKQITLVKNSEVTESITESVKQIGVTVKTADDFAKAVANGSKNIKLEANIKVDSSVVVPADESIVVDLNGKKLETGLNDKVNGKHFYAFDVKGELTLKNGTVNARGIQVYNGGKVVIPENANVTVNSIDSNGGACFWVYAGGEVEINGGTFTAMNGVKWSNGTDYSLNPGVINSAGKVTINGGTFKSAETICYLVQNSGEMVINGGTFEGTHGILANYGNATVNGGTFTLKAYNDGNFDGHVVFCSGEGSVVTVKGGTFGGYTSVFFEAAKGKIEDKR